MTRCSKAWIIFTFLSVISLAHGISRSPTLADVKSRASVPKRRKKSHTALRNNPHDGSISLVDTTKSSEKLSSTHQDAINVVSTRGGDAVADDYKPPSIYWAVLHNWLYFLSLGFNLINIQFLVREIVDGDAKAKPSPRSIALSGKVESVDKLLTFLGIGFLSALSDKFGRKPLM